MDPIYPYHCGSCSYACKLPQNLATHMKTHRKGCPILTCEVCNVYHASNNLQLARHRNTEHPEHRNRIQPRHRSAFHPKKKGPHSRVTSKQMRRIESNNNEPFFKVPSGTGSIVQAPRVVSIQGKLAQIEMVDFQENNKRNVDFVSKTQPFGGSTDDKKRIFGETLQQKSIVYEQDPDQLRPRSRNGRVSNATLEKGSADKSIDKQIRRSRYAENVKMPPGIDDFQCQQCRKSYLSLESLQIHMESHGKKKHFQCPKCSYASGQSGAFLTHLKTHQGGIVFPCDECDFETPSTIKLTRHRNQFHEVVNSNEAPTHHAAPTPQQILPIIFSQTERKLNKSNAQIPSKGQSNSSIIESHKSASPLSIISTTHFLGGGKASNNESVVGVNGAKRIEIISKKRQYQKFLSSVQAKANNRLRRNRPRKRTTIPSLIYSCPSCPKKFTNRQNLEVHIRIHTGEKPYQCPLCPYTSNQKSNIRRHMELHRVGKKLIACAICGYAVSSIAGLNSHYKKTHKDSSHPIKKHAPPSAIIHGAELKSKEEFQKLAASGKEFEKIRNEAPAKHMNAKVFPKQEVQEEIDRIFGESERSMLEKKGSETSKAEVKTLLEVSPKQTSESKNPLLFKCELCPFSCKFKIGLNKHVAKFHTNKPTNPTPDFNQNPEPLSTRTVIIKEEVPDMVVEEIPDKEYDEQIFINVDQDAVDDLLEPQVDPLAIIMEAPVKQEPTETNSKVLICAFCQERFSRDILLDNHMRIHSVIQREKAPIKTPILSLTEDTTTTVNITDSDDSFNLSICNVRSLHESLIQPGPVGIPASLRESLNQPGPVVIPASLHKSLNQPGPKVMPAAAPRRRGRRPDWKGPPGFTCPYCQKRLGSFQGLEIHIRTHTGEKPFACTLCHYSTNQKINLKTHMKSHRNSTVYRCPHCDFTSSNQMTAKIHINQAHGLKKQKSRIQSKSPQPQFQTPVTIQPISLLSIPSTSSSVSPINPPVTIQPVSLLSIPSTNSSASPINPSLTPPPVSILTLKPVPAPALNSAPPNKSVLSSLQAKITNTHSSSSFPRQFNSSTVGSFSNTTLTTTTGPWTPRMLPQKASHQVIQELLANTKTGHIPGKFPPINSQHLKSSMTDFNFKQINNNLSTGTRSPRKSKAKPVPKSFVCSFCSRQFKQRNQLLCHTRIHTGEKPFACSVCNYATSHQQSLIIHSRRHTGEKPYSCNVCGHPTASLPALYIHRKRHTPPFKCRFCSRESWDGAVIIRHEARHLFPE